MLFRTRWKQVVVGVLALGSVSSCSDVDLDSQQSSNTLQVEDAGQRELRSSQLRILPLGDSITEITCSSQLLWQSLHDAGFQDFDMVGTQQSKLDCGVSAADRDNEGHGGYRATDLVDDGVHAAELKAWCNADKGNVVLFHMGTNDIAHTKLSTATILSAFSKILAQLRAAQPQVMLFVAQIIPLQLSECEDCAAHVLELNQQIPGWAQHEQRGESPVYVVDQFSGFDTALDTDDGIHPNRQGSQKMAERWSAAILQHLVH